MSGDLSEARAALAGRDLAKAEAAARRAIALSPSSEAYDLLSSALRGQDRLEDALSASSTAVELNPGNAMSRHGRAQVLSRMGRFAEALGEFDTLIERGVTQAPLWLNRGVALLGLTRVAEAQATFEDGVRRWPQDQGLQNALANVRWMRGEGERFARDFGAAVKRQPEAAQLRLGYADLLRRADFRDHAEAVLREGLQREPKSAALQSALGTLLDEMDRTAEGLPMLQRAASVAPPASYVHSNLIAALLRLGRSDEAMREVAPLRQLQPFNGEWIAYESMALRQQNDPRYHELCDYDLMVQPFDLEPPAGFADIAAFNQALRESLGRLHVLETHPLDQSLRGGSQTTRSLLTIDDPVIRQYLKALEAPIRAYIATMQKPDHPWSGRKSERFKLSGCWSVKLKPNGYHINHLHPEGWISSAYYVSLPEVTRSGASHEGWIKFGEPRWPTPGCAVEKLVQPREGRLVLFPSYMWHGTIPFSAGQRITAPFDVVPA